MGLSDMSLDSIFLSLVFVCTVAGLVMWFYSCSCILTPVSRLVLGDGTRRTLEVKFKQDVWNDFLLGIRQECLLVEKDL